MFFLRKLMPDSKRLNWPTARANLLWTRCVWHSGVLCGFLFSVNLCRGMSNAIRSGGVWTALVNRRFCHFLGSCHHFLCVSDSLMTFRWCELIIVCLSSLWQDITERNTISRFTSFHYVFFWMRAKPGNCLTNKDSFHSVMEKWFVILCIRCCLAINNEIRAKLYNGMNRQTVVKTRKPKAISILRNINKLCNCLFCSNAKLWMIPAIFPQMYPSLIWFKGDQT